MRQMREKGFYSVCFYRLGIIVAVHKQIFISFFFCWYIGMLLISVHLIWNNLQRFRGPGGNLASLGKRQEFAERVMGQCFLSW